MIKLWHISDVHLSFDSQGKIKKDMNQRKWSKGTKNYDGYLEKIKKMGTDHIGNSDFVVITGDLTHDSPHKDAIFNLKWLRENINGTLILIKGNHDVGISFPKLRMEFGGSRVFLLDEGEVLSIGPYTFGCYSNHEDKTSGPHDKYISMAKQVVDQAKQRRTTPIMLSHYPVPYDVAKKIGKTGCKGYFSGHIHCTKNTSPDGNDFTWYNQDAKPTNDKVIEGCFFSTGTTDVNLQLNNGKIFKHAERFDKSILNDRNTQSFRSRAAAAFGCPEKQVSKFDKQDPFNKMNHLTGFICRKKGPMQGSMYITHVNGVQGQPQLIFGTPKLEYPYKNPSTRDWIDKPKATAYYLANKWNGMNVLFYKYFDAHGTMFITAKSKGTPFLSDTEVGNFYSMTCEVLGFTGRTIMNEIHPILMPLFDERWQSMSFELYGKKEPHLVKYDAEIDLAPLFATDYEGNIIPDINEHGTLISEADDIIQICKDKQDEDFLANEEFRNKHGLPLRYEYEHFCTEGRVLYVLGDNGMVSDRTIYKVKPKDIEEVHWGSFDKTMEGRVIEVINKIKSNEEEITEKTLQEELDMGPKEWSRFGQSVMNYVHILQNVNEKDNREVLVLVGLPASGKSTLAKALEASGKYIRINQDDLGSSNKCKGAMVDALKKNRSVVIDRVNFNESQRKRWIDLAQKMGVTNVNCIVVDQSVAICKDRIQKRENHPTVPSGPKAVKIVDNFIDMMTTPTTSEGFGRVMYVQGDQDDIDQLVSELSR